MDIWDALRVVMRRWYVALPVIIVSAVVITQVGTRVNAEYSAESSFVLVGHSTTRSDEGDAPSAFVNPYLSFSSSLSTTAQVLQLSVSSSEARRTVGEKGLATNYEVTVASRSPIVNVSVKADDPEVAVDTLDQVAQLLQDELDVRQDVIDAPADERIGLSVLSEGDAPTTQLGNQNRVRLIFAGVGIASAVAAAFLVEGIAAALGRRRRHAGVSLAGEPEPAPDEPGPVADLAGDDDRHAGVSLAGEPEPAPDEPGPVADLAGERRSVPFTATAAESSD